MAATNEAYRSLFQFYGGMAATSTTDGAENARWKFGETNGFVVRDWTGVAVGGEPVQLVLKAADIFDYIADASQRKAKIAVYAIGPCVIDWSK